ncbi:uncharacterized protein LOC109704314 [Ananas comosus]|uniref:Uncharacterized protein LOC109704314 n=1 Tax=Ananas comosus TaxID=4615 RepID=A0A6P5EBF1_ANACO|nr:uncharacterized protein LOC109704314 [Ananas comosus]
MDLVHQLFAPNWLNNCPLTRKSLRTWPSTSEAYLTWLDRVEAAFGDFWQEVGIYEAIQLSRHSPIVDNLLLAAALCFWSPASNVFLFKRGPFTPTLFDVAAITGLRPHGVSISMSYNPDGVSEFEDRLDLNDLAYSKFIRKFAGEFPAPVTKNEHTSFLLYWLCHNLFCTRSQKINRDFVPIAVGLSNGDRLALGPYFLAFVYREIFNSLKTLHSGDGIAISSGCGVFWFLQMFLQFYIPALCQSPFNPTSVAQFDSYGLALGCPQPMTLGQPSDFLTYFKIFYEPSPESAVSWAPFPDRLTGPSWFLARFEAIRDELASSRASEYLEVRYSYLTPRDLHVGLKSRSKLLPSTEAYSPQYVARQFGFVQPIPAPSKFFTINTADHRPPTKSIAEADKISAMGNRLRRFFKLVSFRPNYTGVALTGYATSTPASSSVPTSNKRPTETVQVTPPPTSKRRKLVAKRQFRQAEGVPSADKLEDTAEDMPSASIPTTRTEDIPSANIPLEETVVPSSATEQSHVPTETIDIGLRQVSCQ